MIIEGLLTTTDDDGRPHVAPMGPVVDPELKHWTLRPFASSTTFRLLTANPHCVFHVIDDVVPVVESALSLTSSLSFESHAWRSRETAGTTKECTDQPEHAVVWTIPTACHWYHLQVTAWDLSQERSQATAAVLEHRVLRPFWGWNRAKHAVLEATILATRLHLIDRPSLELELARLCPAIDKTAGPREKLAWQMLHDYFGSHS